MTNRPPAERPPHRWQFAWDFVGVILMMATFWLCIVLLFCL